MPSPFPGMDPWLEHPAIFPDLHNAFIIELGNVINARLPRPYYATSGSRIWIDRSYRLVEPDLNVLYPSSAATRSSAKKRASSDGTATKPKRIHIAQAIENDETAEWFLEIYARPGNEQLVTSIELLSPANKKPGHTGRELYQKKQDEILRSRVHLVEIDLLRGGMHTTAVPRVVLEEKCGAFDYHVSIRPFDEPDEFLIYAWTLEAELPRITVPLLPGEAAVVVNLRAILDTCYDGRNYDRRVQYRKQKPMPPLARSQKAWAERILKAHNI